MKYTEYKKAAKRHLDTCHHLLNNIDSISPEFRTPRKSREDHQYNLMLGIYYLSGYVVECVLKFTFFQSIHFERNRDVKSLNKEDCTITFENLKTNNHRLAPLVDLVGKFDKNLPENIPCITEKLAKGDLRTMFEEWESSFRYTQNFKTNITLNRTLISEYLLIISSIHSKLSNR